MIFNKITKRIFVAIIDFIILSISLYFSISLRYFNFQNLDRFTSIYLPFLIIIFTNILVFYIYGLYDKMTIKIYKELDKRILSSQILSSIIVSIIFYTTPFFAIEPKTILIIYILISSILIFIWRKYARLFIKSSTDIKILLVAEGQELEDLKNEIENNKIINATKVEKIDLKEDRDLHLYTKIKNKITDGEFNILAINMYHPHIKNVIALFYDLFLEKKGVINFADLYEEIFEKIPLENIDASWFVNNLYPKNNNFYEKIKRFVDLFLSLPAFTISLIFYPFVYILLKIQDKGSIFYTAERLGKNNQTFKIYKFRSMTNITNEDIDVASKDESKRVTSFGSFLRKTRIDELPQLINVIKGDLSLIGPRPEFPKLVKEYSNQIPFYGIRHTITPGLSGYAQIYQDQESVPKFGLAIDATKEKLSYDIYYLKHRSLLLDISLMIKTIKILIGKTGL